MVRGEERRGSSPLLASSWAAALLSRLPPEDHVGSSDVSVELIFEPMGGGR